MRLTLLAIAGTILSAAADSPLRLLTHKLNDINGSALSCIQDINYSPPCDTNTTVCWCKDTTFLSQVTHCITDASSGSVESTLTKLQKWCNLEIPNEPTLVPYKDRGAHTSLRSAINHLSKRYGGYQQPSNGIPWQAILGICAGIGIVGIIISFLLKGIIRDRENNPYRAGNSLPVYEPSRGRPPPRAHPRPSVPRAAQTTRASTPPPPYIREPEAAHVKNNSEDPGLPSYDDHLRGSNAV